MLSNIGLYGGDSALMLSDGVLLKRSFFFKRVNLRLLFKDVFYILGNRTVAGLDGSFVCVNLILELRNGLLLGLNLVMLTRDCFLLRLNISLTT